MAFRERDYIEDVRTKIARLRDGGTLEDSLGLYIFAQLRTHFEKTGINTFDHIKFYADWMFHHQLDRNKTGRRIVREMMGVLKDNTIAPELKTREINRGLGHSVLRTELNEFFERNNIDRIFLENEVHWRGFFGQICRLLVAKPINLIGLNEARFEANEITGVDYSGFPVFWLFSNPGERINSYVACLREGTTFSQELVEGHAENGIIIFESGLYWDAL